MKLRLAVTAHIAEDDFAARLDRAIVRSGVKVIEHRAEPETNTMNRLCC